jgi:hypothetical protein
LRLRRYEIWWLWRKPSQRRAFRLLQALAPYLQCNYWHSMWGGVLKFDYRDDYDSVWKYRCNQLGKDWFSCWNRYSAQTWCFIDWECVDSERKRECHMLVLQGWHWDRNTFIYMIRINWGHNRSDNHHFLSTLRGRYLAGQSSFEGIYSKANIWSANH